MEEILASIRRIIADDQEAVRGADDVYSSSPLKNVLELAERHVVPLSFDAEEGIDLEGQGADGKTGDDEPLLDEAEPVFLESCKMEAVPHPEPARVSDAASVPAPAERVAVPPQREPAAVLPEPRTAGKTAPREPVQDNLLSSAANASVSDAFSRLGSSVATGTPRSLEDVVTDMLRPLLKEWLDENLPPLVERLVQAEIERISRMRRRD